MAENKQTDEQKIAEERYGSLKMKMESEGDGYFFYGYGLPSDFAADKEIADAFNSAEQAVDSFKTLVEKKIIENGGDPEDWEA